MLDTFFGKKVNQSQIYIDNGNRIAVTNVFVAPCTVVQLKKGDKDGYWALQVGIDQRVSRNITLPLKGHLKKTGQGNYLPRFLREIRLRTWHGEENFPYKLGEQIGIEKVLQIGDLVKVTGTSKSKGFQGGVKRYGFKGGPRTHGQSDRERAPGSIGQTTTPGRVYKGKRMAGRMGGGNVTTIGLKVVQIDTEKHLLTLKGLIPGRVTGLIKIQKQS